MSDKPKEKVDGEVDILSLPNQVVVFAPTSAKVERLVVLLKADKNIAVHRVATPEEMVQVAKQTSPCLLLLSAANKEDILKGTTALGAIRELVINRQVVKAIAISKIDDKRLQKAFGFLGCNEFVIEGIPDHTVYFKISLALKSLRMKRSQAEKELARKKKKEAHSGSGTENEKRGGASRFEMRAALDLPEDTWILGNFKPRRVGLNWVIDLEGPDPYSGEWKSLGGTDAARWFWKSKDENGNETKTNSDATGWTFSGNRPNFDVKSGKWKLVSKDPQLFYKAEGKVIGSKIETKGGNIGIAADSGQSSHNIEKTKEIGAKVKALRQADPSSGGEEIHHQTEKQFEPEDNEFSDGADYKDLPPENWEAELPSPRAHEDSEEEAVSVSVSEEESVQPAGVGEGSFDGTDEIATFDTEAEAEAEVETKREDQQDSEDRSPRELTEEDERAELAALQKRYYEGLPLSATEKKRLATLKRKFAKEDSYDDASNSTSLNHVIAADLPKGAREAEDYIIEQEEARGINNKLTEDEEPAPFNVHQSMAKKRRRKVAGSPSGKQYSEIAAKVFASEMGVWSHVDGFGFVYITPEISALKISEMRSHPLFWVMQNTSNEGPYYKSTRESWLFDRDAPMPENVPGFALLDYRVQKHLEIMTGEMLGHKDAHGRISVELEKQEARTYEMEAAGETLEPTPELSPELSKEETESKAKQRAQLKSRLNDRKKRREEMTPEQKEKAAAAQNDSAYIQPVQVGYLPFQLSLSERMMRKETPEQLFPWICEEVARECDASRVAIIKNAVGSKEFEVLGSNFDTDLGKVDSSFLLASMQCIEQALKTGIKTFDSNSGSTSIVYPIKGPDATYALMWLELSSERGPFTEVEEKFIVEVVLKVLWKFFKTQPSMAQAA